MDELNAAVFNKILYDCEAEDNMLRSPAIAGVICYSDALLIIVMHCLWFPVVSGLFEELADRLRFHESLC